MYEQPYGTDKLYREALLKADMWYEMSKFNKQEEDYWFGKFAKGARANSHLTGLAIFQGLVILGLLIVLFVV